MPCWCNEPEHSSFNTKGVNYFPQMMTYKASWWGCWWPEAHCCLVNVNVPLTLHHNCIHVPHAIQPFQPWPPMPPWVPSMNRTMYLFAFLDSSVCDLSVSLQWGCDWLYFIWCLMATLISGLILGLRPANERQRYFVTMSLISWAQA